MDRCSACRARLNNVALCPRCGCDFTYACRAEAQAQRFLGLTIASWAEGNTALAKTRMSESLFSKNGDLAKSVSKMLYRPASPNASEFPQVILVGDAGELASEMHRYEYSPNLGNVAASAITDDPTVVMATNFTP